MLNIFRKGGSFFMYQSFLRRCSNRSTNNPAAYDYIYQDSINNDPDSLQDAFNKGFAYLRQSKDAFAMKALDCFEKADYFLEKQKQGTGVLKKHDLEVVREWIKCGIEQAEKPEEKECYHALFRKGGQT